MEAPTTTPPTERSTSLLTPKVGAISVGHTRRHRGQAPDSGLQDAAQGLAVYGRDHPVPPVDVSCHTPASNSPGAIEVPSGGPSPRGLCVALKAVQTVSAALRGV